MFAALLLQKIDVRWPHETQTSIAASQTLAKKLLSQQIEICALHGDLHHDNIRLSDRGYLAFDPKGLIGDRAYDLANLFKNPVDAPAVFGDPDRITRKAEDLAKALDTSPKRILSWAVAHCGLPIVWIGQIATDPLVHQLHSLQAALQTSPD